MHLVDLSKNYNLVNLNILSDATKHPNWKMGKKISELSTLMNKVFEVIELQDYLKLITKKLKLLFNQNLIYTPSLNSQMEQ